MPPALIDTVPFIAKKILSVADVMPETSVKLAVEFDAIAFKLVVVIKGGTLPSLFAVVPT